MRQRGFPMLYKRETERPSVIGENVRVYQSCQSKMMNGDQKPIRSRAEPRPRAQSGVGRRLSE